MKRNHGLEERVTALEKEVTLLKTVFEEFTAHKDWWKRLAGTFENDPLFDQIVKEGRAYRLRQRDDRK